MPKCGQLILHYCLEVSHLHDFGLTMLGKIRQVSIATDNIVGTYGLSQREEVEIFGVADSCSRGLGADDDELAESVNDGQQVVDVGLSDVFADFVATDYIADFLDKAGTNIYIEAHVGKHPTHKFA